jgi:hypothetical protein
MLHLTGSPASLETTDGTVQNDLIVWDGRKVSTSGIHYRMHVRTAATNTVDWTKQNFMKPGRKTRTIE